MTEVFEGIKTGVTEKVNEIKTSISDIFGKAKDLVIEIFENLKTGISEKINDVKTAISTVFETVKDIMTSPFETAKKIFSGVIDKIRGFLDFNWEFPKLKMPHFSVSGSMNPLKWIDEGVPKLSVDWYAKGGIFDKPTIFNTPYGLKGVGDASSPEVVAPLNDLNSMISQGINRAISPLLMARTQDEAPIIEFTFKTDDETLYSATLRGKQKHERRYEAVTDY